jgi:hypothetical protein
MALGDVVIAYLGGAASAVAVFEFVGRYLQGRPRLKVSGFVGSEISAVHSREVVTGTAANVRPVPVEVRLFYAEVKGRNGEFFAKDQPNLPAYLTQGQSVTSTMDLAALRANLKESGVAFPVAVRPCFNDGTGLKWKGPWLQVDEATAET